MKLGITQMAFGKRASVNMDLIRHAEKLGFYAAWTAEAYGNDAVSTASWILAQTETIHVGTAIMQMPARSPAATAMTAMTLDHLSGGRFILGLGPSGPQVAEGWHGQVYGKPLTRTKEYIAIIRQILRREGNWSLTVNSIRCPTRGRAVAGQGKPLKSILHGNPEFAHLHRIDQSERAALRRGMCRWRVPGHAGPGQIYRRDQTTPGRGFARAGEGKSRSDFVVAPNLFCAVGDYDQFAPMIKGNLGLYIGGMGAKNKNFYTDYVSRLGFEEEAHRIQDLYLAGKQQEAIEAVPDAMVNAMHLIGSEEKIRERLQAWKASGARGEVDMMNVSALQPEALDIIADEML